MLEIAVCGWGEAGSLIVPSFKATTIPVVEERVLRGLLYADGDVLPSTVVEGTGETAWETATRIPPSTAGLGRFVRCQS